MEWQSLIAKNGKFYVNEGKKFGRIDTRAQFHQHSTYSFYAHRSQ